MRKVAMRNSPPPFSSFQPAGVVQLMGGSFFASIQLEYPRDLVVPDDRGQHANLLAVGIVHDVALDFVVPCAAGHERWRGEQQEHHESAHSHEEAL